MEMISEKADALKNKMRPGSIFVSKRTDNLKYVDQNGAECWVVPMSRYYASETILRGQPVAICQLSDFEETDKRAEDKYPYIKVYNPNVDEFCIGVATNYAEEGTIVQIQNRGKFNYLTANSIKAKAEGKNPKEVYIDTSNSAWIYKSMRGQTIYVCSNEVEFNNHHDSKKDSVDNSKILTYDFIDSVYTAANTIQLGHLTDAPTTLEDDDQVITIELDVTGDTRGPLDNTQYILTLGEDIFFKEGNENPENGVFGPYNDQGIFNEVKAVALATHGPEKSKFGWYPKTLNNEEIGTETSFIAVRKMDGKSVIVSKFEDFDELCNALTAANDRGYMSLLRSTYNDEWTDNKPVMVKVESLTMETAKEEILKAFKLLDGEVFADIEWVPQDPTSTADIKALVFEAALAGGYYDIYESEDLVRFVNIKTIKHGSEAEAGTAILADIRDENRTNVVGVVLSNQPGVHKKGETIKVMKMGRYVAQGVFKPGAEYFLGLEGRINTKKHYWYDTAVKIGVAENDKQLLVDIQEMQHEFNGSFPLGYIKQSMGGEAERGFLLMDGVTGYDCGTYPELLEALRAWYKDEELAYYYMKPQGDGSDPVRTRDESKFIIPKVTFNDGMNVAEIKATPDGIYHQMPRLPFIRSVGNINEDGTINNLDVTRLVHYGTLEQSRIAPTLENIEVRLFVREPQTKLYEDIKGQTGKFADDYVWREIPKGFQLYNNDQIFGYEWVILQDDYAASNWVGIDENGKPVERRDGLYVLHMNIENGLGICKFGQNAQPISLKGAEYKLIVTAKNLWEREYNLMEVEDLAETLDMDNDTMAPTVTAVKRYYEKEVVTKRLEVTDANGKTQAVVDENGTRIEKLSVGTIEVDGKDIVYEAEQFAEHLAQTADGKYEGIDENGNKVEIKGVHGIYNKGVEGNIDARTLGGLKVSDGARSLSKNTADGYIPYVQDTGDTDIGLNLNRYSYAHEDGKLAELVMSNVVILNKDANRLLDTTTIADKDITQYVKQLNFGTTVIKATLDQRTDKLDIYLKEGTAATSKNINIHGINSIDANEIVLGSQVLTAAVVQQLVGGSTVALKNVFSELLRYKPTTYSLEPNTSRDAEGNPVGTYTPAEGTYDYKDLTLKVSETAVKKFSSALQALHELPLALWQYKYGSEDYKEQLGILIERVNQTRSEIETDPAMFSHKRNSWMKSNNPTLLDAEDGYDESGSYGHKHEPGETDVYEGTANEAHDSLTEDRRIASNSYTYTKEEVDSIVNYLNLITSKKELQQEIRSTVGILLKAAQETQDRLLDVETSIFGFDADTVPGDKLTAVGDNIATELAPKINNTPLLLGLNRLMRAICLELFDTTDLEQIDAETKSVLGDSDNLQTKVTLASRMDKIDELIGDLIARYNGLVRFYEDALNHAELRRTYEHLSQNGENVISKDASLIEQDEILEEGTVATHDRTITQVDSTGTWKTLPSKEDLVKSDENFVGYSERNTEHENKHRPNPGKDGEVGIVRIPEFEDAKFPFQVSVIGEDGKQVVKDVTIRQIKYDYNTGKPYFKSQGVAWLDSKVERINLKLSEVTKAIYGLDEVGHELPNRTETMRRNITNLVDDLYPNRSFAVENKLKNDLYNPFENSTDIETGSKNINKDGEVIELTNQKGDEKIDVQHTSIIKHLVDDMYSFNISQKYLPVGAVEINELVGEETYWPQIIKDIVNGSSISDHTISFDASHLTSEVEKTNGVRSFSEAYSQFDLLRDVIGVKNVWVNELSASKTLWNLFSGWEPTSMKGTLVNISDGKELEDTNVLTPNWRSELAFNKASYGKNEDGNSGKLTVEEGEVSRELKFTGYTDTVLSRKEKDLASRITTVEAALDSTAHFVKAVVDNGSKGLNTAALNQFGRTDCEDKARFEEMNIEDSLSKAVHGVNAGDNNMWTIFNTDFEECNKWEDHKEVREHNLAIMNLIKNDYEILGWNDLYNKEIHTRTFKVKRSYAIVNSFADRNKTDLFEETVKGAEVIITVTYVDKVTEPFDNKTIYLERDDVTDESAKSVIKGDTENVAGIKTKKDQESANEIDMLHDIIKHMYQDNFDMAHPEGSYFWSNNCDEVTDELTGEKSKVPVFDIPEYAAGLINVGVWERVYNKFIFAKGDGNFVAENPTGEITLKVEQLPTHIHSNEGVVTSVKVVNELPNNPGADYSKLPLVVDENSTVHSHSIPALAIEDLHSVDIVYGASSTNKPNGTQHGNGEYVRVLTLSDSYKTPKGYEIKAGAVPGNLVNFFTENSSIGKVSISWDNNPHNITVSEAGQDVIEAKGTNWTVESGTEEVLAYPRWESETTADVNVGHYATTPSFTILEVTVDNNPVARGSTILSEGCNKDINVKVKAKFSTTTHVWATNGQTSRAWMPYNQEVIATTTFNVRVSSEMQFDSTNLDLANVRTKSSETSEGSCAGNLLVSNETNADTWELLSVVKDKETGKAYNPFTTNAVYNTDFKVVKQTKVNIMPPYEGAYCWKRVKKVKE